MSEPTLDLEAIRYLADNLGKHGFLDQEDIARAAIAEVDRLRAELAARDGHDREQRAAAWDEGYEAGHGYASAYEDWWINYDDDLVEDDALEGRTDRNLPAPQRPANPYRADRIEASHDE